MSKAIVSRIAIEVVGNLLWSRAFGRKNAKTIKYICGITGCQRRTVELATEEIRRAGTPLASATSNKPLGLYIARSRAEFEPYIRQIESRIKKMAFHRSQMIKYLDRLDQIQTELNLK